GLSGEQADGVTQLAAAVAAADGIEALTEQMLLNLTDSHREVTHLLLTAPAPARPGGGDGPDRPGSAVDQSGNAHGDGVDHPSSAVEILGYAQIDDGSAEL